MKIPYSNYAEDIAQLENALCRGKWDRVFSISAMLEFDLYILSKTDVIISDAVRKNDFERLWNATLVGIKTAPVDYYSPSHIAAATTQLDASKSN